MEGDTFVLFALHDQCGDGDPFGWSIGNVVQTVFVETVPQSDPLSASHDIRDRVCILPASQLFRAQREEQFFREIHHRTFEGQTGDLATLGCCEDGDESSKA